MRMHMATSTLVISFATPDALTHALVCLSMYGFLLFVVVIDVACMDLNIRLFVVRF